MTPPNLPPILRLIVACLCTICLAGCDTTSSDPTIDHPEGADEVRVVSLSPAISRMLSDLGLAKLVVGRTRYCESIPSEVPVVGDHFSLDYESLVRLRPTHVMVQPPRGEQPEALRRLADEHAWTVGTFSMDRIDDIGRQLKRLTDLLEPSLGSDRERVRGLADNLRESLDRLRQPRASTGWQGTVLLVYGINGSISVFGNQTYLGDILHSFGCENAAPHISGWGQLTIEDIARIDPEAILVVREGGVSASGPPPLGPLAELDIRAIRTGRVGLLTNRDALLPSTSIIEVVDEMRGLIESFEEPG